MTANLFWCLRVRRDGAPMPRWQQSRAEWVHGQLLVREQHDGSLGRSVIVARLVDVHRAELLPNLIDAKLLLVDHDRTVLNGLERDCLTRREVAQTWLLIAGDAAPLGAGVMHPD